MEILKIAAQLLMNHLGKLDLNENSVVNALAKLLPTNGGDLDISGLLSKFSGGGLGALASSWLGDGDNSSILPNQILSIFGDNKVDEFANDLNIDKNAATKGLASIIPDLIDMKSQGGSLLDNLGGIGKLFS